MKQKTPNFSLLVKIRNFTILLTLVLVPIAYLPQNIDQFRFIKAGVLFINTSILILIQTYLVLNGFPLFIPNRTIIKLILAFLFFYFVSFLVSIHKLTSFWGVWGLYTDSLIYQVILIAFFFLIFQYISQKDSIKKISKALLLTGTAISLLAIYQYFFYGWPRPKSILEGSNFLAYFIGSIIPFNLYLVNQQKKQLNRIYYLILLAINILAFILSFSRNGWFLFLLSASLVLFLRRRIANFWSKNFFLTLLVALAVLLFFSRSIFLRITSVWEDLHNQSGSFPIRMAEQRVALKLFFTSKPFYQYLLGTGPSTLTYTILKVRPSFFNYLPEQERQRIGIVRNQYLQFLNTNGLLGLVALTLIIGFTFLVFLKSKKDSLTSYLFISWFFLALSYFFTSQSIESGLLFWTFQAMIWSRVNIFKKRINLLKPVTIFLTFFIIIFSAFVLGFSALSLASEYYASQGNYAQAVKINPYNDFYWREFGLGIHRDAYFKNDFGQMTKAAKVVAQAYKLNPHEPRNLDTLSLILYQQAVVFKTKERLGEALKLTLDWVSIDPSNPQAYDAVGLAYLELGQPALALTYFLKEAEVDNNSELAYGHSGEAYKQLGQFDKAIQSYKKALEIAPAWTVAQEELKMIINLKSSLDK